MSNMGSKRSPFRILDGSEVALDELGAAGAPGNVGWHLLAVQGKWDGHWMGPFSVGEKDIEQMEQHIRSSGVKIPVDYGHATLFDREAPASGWLASVERRPSGGMSSLVGQIEWTDRAAAAIRSREYRYLSPTIQFHTRDRATSNDVGTSLHSVALTNKPFLHELPEVRLNSIRAAFWRLAEEDSVNEEQRKKMAVALGLSEGATAEEIFEKITALSAAGSKVDALFVALGAKDAEAATRAVLELKTAATLGPARAAVDATTFERIKTENEQLKAAELRRSALSAVQKAQSEGRVLGGKLDEKGNPDADSTPNFKAAWEFACRDLVGFTAYIATVQAQAPVEEFHLSEPSPSSGSKTGPVGLTARAAAIKIDPLQAEVNRAMGLSDDVMRHFEDKYPRN